MVIRRGGSLVGCLFSLLVISAVVYVGIGAGETYWRYYQYKDAMAQQVRLARHSSDEEMLRRLRAVADSLDLPAAARKIAVRRARGRITIESIYHDRLQLPLIEPNVRFHPRAEGTY